MEPHKTIIGSGYAAKKSIITTSYAAKKTTIGNSIVPHTTVININEQVSGAISATSTISITGTASLRATGLIIATSSVSISGSAGLTGVTYITATASLSVTGSVSMIGTGLMIAAATVAITGEATLTGTSPGEGLMTGNATMSVTGQASLIGTGLVVPSATISITGTAGLIGSGYMTAVANVSISGSASLMATGLITGTATAQITGSAALMATGLMSATSSISITGSATVVDGSGGDYDADAEAFLGFIGIPDDATVYNDGTAQEMTGHDIWVNVDATIVALKDAGLWTGLKALWLRVGGTAATHKINAKDPRDLDAAFRITFAGGWTHSGTGSLPNGSTAYGDTHLIPNDHLTSSAGAIGLYSRTDSNAGQPYDISASNSGGAATAATGIIIRYSTSAGYGLWGTATYICSSGVSVSYRGFIVSRASGTTTFYKEGTSLDADDDYSAMCTYPLYDGCNNGAGTAELFSNKERSFTFVTADALSGAQVATMNTIMDNFETSMIRNV